MKKQSVTFKLLVIGDSGVGKTSLLMRYCQDNFQTDLLSTVGVDFKIKRVKLDNKDVCLNIWDTAGQERFKNITKSFYKNAQGIVLTYSIDNSNTFNHISNWIEQIRQNGSNDVAMILVATKIDLQSNRQVSRDAGVQFAKQYGIKHLEVSAKQNRNIDAIFQQLTRQILIKNPVKQTIQKTIITESEKQKKKKKSDCC